MYSVSDIFEAENDYTMDKDFQLNCKFCWSKDIEGDTENDTDN